MTNRVRPSTGHNEGEELTVEKAKRQTQFQRLTTPRAAAFAGILFSLLFSVSVILLRTALPQGAVAGNAWAHGGSTRINLALRLIPFAGIAFLWFIGVIRDRLGDYEDRFFSTVFFGSGLLFLAMVFVSAGVAAATLASGELTKTENSQVIYLRPCHHAPGEQRLRHKDGRRFYDLVGYYLVAHRADATLAGSGFVPCGLDASGGHKPQFVVGAALPGVDLRRERPGARTQPTSCRERNDPLTTLGMPASLLFKVRGAGVTSG